MEVYSLITLKLLPEKGKNENFEVDADLTPIHLFNEMKDSLTGPVQTAWIKGI